ncbi:MAG TPA: 30S ribosomal protein S12 methylthiotransferase RimO [Candidatus Avipropionibacterium avicola]|uniref:Ribosomal protein uS12 methylthiotransferase RimO n=1 Tax=Candidatus Avipropionibacterium avicola TaxID=2840701 RepID=A0A9D1H047_9ACTN|nr:30S ribosomal protein S12 methylthiotransferase RimO [Candidatus Avipropionibacterium avicola]
MTQTSLTPVHLVTLGCARNEVDSAELAARLEAGGFQLVDDPESAEAVMVNTCGFIEQAKKDSIDQIIEASDAKDRGQAKAVVAVGCMAERYGAELADNLTEADAVLGFDDYPDIAAKLQSIINGERHTSHQPRDRRQLLPISPVARPAVADRGQVPGHGSGDETAGRPASGPPVLRRRIGDGPMAPLKLASGCDRRCSFCAIPSFRGAYLSRPIDEVVAEAEWMVSTGVRETFLVSENSSSYGKDLGDIRMLEKLLPQLARIDGLDWVRVSYLQPAEVRPGLIETMVGTEGVVPYFDLSFQHAAPTVLRRMRRFGDPDRFLGLLEQIRGLAPNAGIRSNFIVGFPGETEDDVAILSDFLTEARLDVVGVFAYSDEEGTEAVGLDGHLDSDEIEARADELRDLADALVDERAAERIGERVEVLVESIGSEDDPQAEVVLGRAAHQGPDVDGIVTVETGREHRIGDLVTATVTDSDGADLVAVENEGS